MSTKVIPTLLSFGSAIELAKRGKRVARKGWNGSGMYVAIMPGYPDGVPCNAATAELHGIPVGTAISINKYWVIKTPGGSISTWAPSGSDSLAEDWVEV